MSSATPAEAAPAVDPDGRPVTVSRRQGRRDTTIGRAFGQGADLLVRVVQLVVSIVVLIIVAGILLVVLKANPANSIVSEVHSWARWLAGPFDGMFSLRSQQLDSCQLGHRRGRLPQVGGLIARLIGPDLPRSPTRAIVRLKTRPPTPSPVARETDLDIRESTQRRHGMCSQSCSSSS